MVSTFTLIPEVKNTPNAFDYFGMLLGLPRLIGERNANYRKRLMDVYVNRASATQQGITNGITRELGLEQFDTIEISYVGPSTYSPRVMVRDVQIELYSNWNLVDETISPNALDGEVIDIYSKDSSSYYVSGLVDAINTSTYFSAIIASDISQHMLSACLIDTDSRIWISGEELKPLYQNHLEYQNIVPGTVTFSTEGDTIFVEQVATEAELLEDGQYYID